MPESRSVFDRDIYRLLVEQTKDYAVFALDTDGRVATWNAGAERAKGYRADEIIGQHFSVFYSPADNARNWPAQELQRAAAEGRFEDEGWRVRKDGSRFWANVVITALRDDAGQLVGFSKFTRDLTDRRRSEEALRESEERFRLLVEGVTDYAIYMLDIDGKVASWNTGAERITGYTRDEIVGAHFSRFYSEDDKATAPWEELATARRLGRAETEGWRIRKDGERFWARVVVTALHDPQNRLYGFAKVTQDLTERRHIQSLEQAARNVGDFIAVLAHELRNPMSPIRTASHLMAKLPAEHPSQKHLREMLERQSNQLARIVDDMLDMARVTRGTLSIEHDAVDLDAVVQAATETVGPLVDREMHALTIDRRPGNLTVHGDAHRLTQLLVNLLNNAARYTPKGGKIALVMSRNRHHASIRVVDDGRGFAPDAKNRIFDMFVRGPDARTSSDGGLGIGLALARKIAELHGGSLEGESAGEGKGASFTLKLPLSTQPTEPRRAAAPMPDVPAQRILVVDDNKDAAAALEMLLRDLGHETRVVNGGRAALESIAEFRPDCVLLDLGMPEVDGLEVARRVRASGLEPQPRLVALTGWGQDDDRERTRAAGFDAHLVKPATSEQIAGVLARAAQPSTKGSTNANKAPTAMTPIEMR